jgi:hypothetical protein
MSQDNQILSNEAPKASRRAILAALAAATTPMVPTLATALNGPPLAGEVDPIFEAFEEHRAAQEALAQACAANGLDIDECPIKSVADRRSCDSEVPLFVTAPTTVAGALALVKYVHSPAHKIHQGEYYPNVTSVLSYAAGFANDPIAGAVKRFPQHFMNALRNIAERGQA